MVAEARGPALAEGPSPQGKGTSPEGHWFALCAGTTCF